MQTCYTFHALLPPHY